MLAVAGAVIGLYMAFFLMIWVYGIRKILNKTPQQQRRYQRDHSNEGRTTIRANVRLQTALRSG